MANAKIANLGYTAWLLLGMLFGLVNFAAAKSIEGQVVAVHDGDTLTLLTRGRESIKVRLAQIDAPELGQAFGQQAKHTLSGLLFNKKVRVVQEDKDRYGRLVGTVWVGALDASREQLRLGMAWAYRQYLHDSTLLQIEESARRDRRGLWAERNPTPPWQYGRRGNKAKKTAHRALNAPRPSCGRKRYCKEMTSCAEAKQYLKQCGLLRLDRNRDGVPCESLCN